jgi:hypothetical protein
MYLVCIVYVLSMYYLRTLSGDSLELLHRLIGASCSAGGTINQKKHRIHSFATNGTSRVSGVAKTQSAGLTYQR